MSDMKKESSKAPTGPVEPNADIGIALAASAGGMSSLQFALVEKDFHKATSHY